MIGYLLAGWDNVFLTRKKVQKQPAKKRVCKHCKIIKVRTMQLKHFLLFSQKLVDVTVMYDNVSNELNVNSTPSGSDHVTNLNSDDADSYSG